MQISQEQIQLRDTFRTFLNEECTSTYLRKRWLDTSDSDSKLWSKLVGLGFFEYFLKTQTEDGGSIRDLSIIAFECGRALLPELFTESLFLGPYLLSRLSEKDSEALKAFSEKFELNELSSSRVSFAAYSEDPIEVKKGTGGLSQVTHTFNYVPSAQSSKYLLFFSNDNNNKLLLNLIIIDDKKISKTALNTLDLLHKAEQVKTSKASCLSFHMVEAKEVQQILFLLCASELAGIASRVVEMTVEFVKTRKQFDAAIGSFQAVQHKLADMHVQSEAMRSLAQFAAWAADCSKKQLELACLTALKFASLNTSSIVETAIQLHGGMGFTWEHDLHFYLRRAKTLEALTSFVHCEKSSSQLLLAAKQ